MQKNTGIIIAVVTLIVGLGLGYAVGANKAPAPVATNTSTSGMHMMPDGTMMGNNGQSMSMADMMASMNAELEGKTGEEFEKAFIDEMIVHHEGAVDMAEILLQKTQRPELVKLGNDIISAQTSEIEMMKEWRQTWFNN